jgi:hypothetical protein
VCVHTFIGGEYALVYMSVCVSTGSRKKKTQLQEEEIKYFQRAKVKDVLL